MPDDFHARLQADALANVLTNLADRYNQEYLRSNGKIADWPSWCADRIVQDVHLVLKNRKATRSQIAELLRAAARYDSQNRPWVEWETAVANQMVSRFS